VWAAAGQDDDRRRHLAEVTADVDSNREGMATYARYGPDRRGAIEKAMDVTIDRHSRPRARPGSYLVPTNSCNSER